MFLLYMDESGDPWGDIMVVGGVLVHEQDTWRLSRAIEEIADRVPWPAQGTELHATLIRSGNKEWRDVPRRQRQETLDRITNLLVQPRQSFEYPLVLFAVAMDIKSNQHHDPIERLYEEFFARCNGFLGRLASSGDRQRCLPIADESAKVEQRVQDLMQTWRAHGGTTGAQIGQLASFAEVPVFVDSRASRSIQLADFVCNTVYRYYSGRNDPEFARLLEAFDHEQGRLHGLTHLVRGYRDCQCVACTSRRR